MTRQNQKSLNDQIANDISTSKVLLRDIESILWDISFRLQEPQGENALTPEQLLEGIEV